MRIVENRKLAWAVLAACVVVSVFLLGGAALSRERGKVLKVFKEGTDSTAGVRYSMDAYLDTAGDRARVMAGEAERHLGASELTESVKANAAIVMDDKAGLDRRSSAYTTLKDDVETLYDKLSAAVDSDTFKAFKLAYDDFWGKDDMMKRDEYHTQARGYNDLISGFPGGAVATITGQGSLNPFGG